MSWISDLLSKGKEDRETELFAIYERMQNMGCINSFREKYTSKDDSSQYPSIINEINSLDESGPSEQINSLVLKIHAESGYTPGADGIVRFTVDGFDKKLSQTPLDELLSNVEQIRNTLSEQEDLLNSSSEEEQILKNNILFTIYRSMIHVINNRVEIDQALKDFIPLLEENSRIEVERKLNDPTISSDDKLEWLNKLPTYQKSRL